jgi:ferric-dicitrate binding protein FerR (iron transport regulator)
MKNDLSILLEKFLLQKWEEASFDPEKEVEKRIWAKLKKQIASKPAIPAVRYPLWKKVTRIAASLLIPLFCMGLGYYFSEMKSAPGGNPVTVQVEVGQKANVYLPDGTHVWLNSAGSLSYDNNNKKERIVYLQGEAYFEVSKDKTRPFIVKANDISVEALGTRFDLKAYPDDNYVTAILMEGSIRVSSPLQSAILAPNEKLTVTKSDGQFTKSVLWDAGKNVSWINNQLSFEQERLEDIAKILERMYSVHIRFVSEKLKDIRFSGTIKNNNLENVLELIAFVSPIRYARENDSTIIIRSQ